MSRNSTKPNGGYYSVFGGSPSGSSNANTSLKSDRGDELAWGQFLLPSEVIDPWGNSDAYSAPVAAPTPLATSTTRFGSSVSLGPATSPHISPIEAKSSPPSKSATQPSKSASPPVQTQPVAAFSPSIYEQSEFERLAAESGNRSNPVVSLARAPSPSFVMPTYTGLSPSLSPTISAATYAPSNGQNQTSNLAPLGPSPAASNGASAKASASQSPASVSPPLPAVSEPAKPVAKTTKEAAKPKQNAEPPSVFMHGKEYHTIPMSSIPGIADLPEAQIEDDYSWTSFYQRPSAAASKSTAPVATSSAKTASNTAVSPATGAKSIAASSSSSSSLPASVPLPASTSSLVSPVPSVAAKASSAVSSASSAPGASLRSSPSPVTVAAPVVVPVVPAVPAVPAAAFGMLPGFNEEETKGSNGNAQSAQSQSPQNEWRLDVTQVPLTSAYATRFLVFVGCKSMNEQSVLKDLRDIGETLPAAQQGAATWQRGSFVLAYAQRKRAMRIYKSLHGLIMHGTKLRYHCELHSPPHTALAKLFELAGKPNPLIAPVKPVAAASVSPVVASKEAVAAPFPVAAPAVSSYASAAPVVASPVRAKATSTAPVVVAQPLQHGKLPSFGGPSAPAAASARTTTAASPSAAAAKKQATLPPVASVAVPPPAAAKKVPSKKKDAPAYVPSSAAPSAASPSSVVAAHATAAPAKAPLVIDGVLFEELRHSEWNPYYNAQNMLLSVTGQECNICMDDLCRGQAIATLFCFCKFHQRCIDNWWTTKMASSKPTDPRHPECPSHPEVIKNAVEQGFLPGL